MPDRPEVPLSWGQLVRQHWPHYCAVVLLLLGLAVSDRVPPQQHALYSASDRQWWTYARPTLPERLPDVDMPLLAVALPLAVLWGASLAGSISRHEAHNMSLALLACVATAGLVAHLLKTQVARPRPDFVQRCWPKSRAPTFDQLPSGLPVCDVKARPRKLVRGLRSFPSGHSTWAGAGLGFFSFWLIGWLGCFRSNGRAQPLQLLLGLLPLAGALAIGCQRVVADKHHEGDVAAGLAIGLAAAALFYLQARASLETGPTDHQQELPPEPEPLAAPA